MNNCKPVNTPIVPGTKLSKNDEGAVVNSTLYKQLVGSLMYLTATRPNIMFVVNLLSQFMESPKTSHWKVGKRILRYIAGTMQHDILYASNEDNQLIGFTDSDFVRSVDDKRNTSGYAFCLGTGLVSWASEK